jgi:hypothetical protein
MVCAKRCRHRQDHPVSELSRTTQAANLFALCRDHKALIDKHVGQELRIQNMKTKTVLDRGGGAQAEGKLHSWHAHGGKNNQMVCTRIHAFKLSLIITLVSGPLSVVFVATTSNTQLLAPTLHPNGHSQTGTYYILRRD